MKRESSVAFDRVAAIHARLEKLLGPVGDRRVAGKLRRPA